MAAYQAILLCLVICFLLLSTSESARKRQRFHQRNLHDYCKAALRRGIVGSAIELHAYFDLTSNNKGFSCLKVSACQGVPVCFVTKQPYLRDKSVNDTTTWQDLMNFIQRDRRIEPIYDHSMDGLNGDKYKALSQFVRPEYQAAIYRMCRDATVYRFVTYNTSSSSNVSTTRSPVTVARTITSQSSNRQRVCEIFGNTSGRSRRVRGKRVQQNSTNNLLQCTGLDCPCERICVGQGKRKNFSDCSTFRVICTFSCGDDDLQQSQNDRAQRRTRKQKRKRRQRNKKNQKKKSD
ncbi:uncharacterized protein LOC116619670 [Nematostella vectensis]|uniref:uncharacterized protein LOC116619670 n=1 Tax=Nematostella vectensis TaxID=45351 RepID=UPI00138FEDD6|nr:uncharacterized protein LOC116619670 [Nematostella vectensis]